MTDKVVTGGVFYGNGGRGFTIEPDRRDARIAELEAALVRAEAALHNATGRLRSIAADLAEEALVSTRARDK